MKTKNFKNRSFFKRHYYAVANGYGYVNEITKTSFLDSSKYCGEEVIVGDSFYVSDKDLVFSNASCIISSGVIQI